MDYTRVMTALRRRRWLILAAVAGCTVATFFGSTRMKHEYLAEATLMPQEEALTPFRDLTAPPDVGLEKAPLDERQDQIKTVSLLLMSPSVLVPVIDNLKLHTTPAELQDRISVASRTSRLVKVSLRDEDPSRAAATVNAIVSTFVTFHQDLRTREAKKQMALLEREQQAAEKELRLAKERLEAYKKQHQLTSITDQTQETLTRSGQIEHDRNAAEARLRDVSAQYETVAAALGRTPATRTVTEQSTNTALLDRLRMDVATLKSALDKELTVHTEEHANVIRLRKELAEAERRLETESGKLQVTTRVIPNPDREALELRLRELRNERNGLMARLGSLNANHSEAQARLARLQGVDVELNYRQQRYTLAEQRLTTIAQRLVQVRSAGVVSDGEPPIAIVDQAGPQNPPFDLSQGRTVRLTALAFVLSLGVCIVLAVALEMGDRRVKTVADVESLMQLPVVSVVPQLTGPSNAGNLCLTAETNPAGHLAESYHFLANHILRQTMRRESTVLMGATARPGQGATTALSNLSIALARAGRQVVLVEADLRRPFLDRVFEAPAKPGLTDVLQERAGVQQALVPTNIKNLRLLPAGTTVEDPWSLLWQPHMSVVVQALRDEADYVIFNVPSATVFADALCVAPHVDGAIMVLRTSEMPNGAENQVRIWLEELDVPVMGVVLNGVPAREMETTEFHRSYTARRGDSPLPVLTAPAAPPVRSS
jgi:polysaccharide biosynthesis transport protein